MAMKYKVGDKVRYRGQIWKVDMGYIKNNENLYFLSNGEMVWGKVKENSLELVKEEETTIRIDEGNFDPRIIQKDDEVKVSSNNGVISIGGVACFNTNGELVKDLDVWAKPALKNGWVEIELDKKLTTHEETIMQLNELNTAKTRQIERLVKYIAKDYTITNDLDYDLIRETLLKDIRDEDLVNMIMFHVRKGK